MRRAFASVRVAPCRTSSCVLGGQARPLGEPGQLGDGEARLGRAVVGVLLQEPGDEARERGRAARAAALSRYGLERFLSDWDEVLLSVEVRS